MQSPPRSPVADPATIARSSAFELVGAAVNRVDLAAGSVEEVEMVGGVEMLPVVGLKINQSNEAGKRV